jgi:predicted TIM-barrel fold metal-dependent hydrolase
MSTTGAAGGNGPGAAARARAEVGHPIIDSDGHVLELFPAVFPYLRQSLGAALFEEFRRQGPIIRRDAPPPSDSAMLASRTPQGAWWGSPNDTRNRATSMLPGLLYERMDELGLDFAVFYTTNALSECSVADDELRQGICRGFNDFYSDAFGPYADRMVAAGIIPMHTPEEAIAELEHCRAIGLKVVAFPEGVLRPIASPVPGVPTLWPGQSHWWDTFGLDSAFDYDPVWARARQLGFAVTFHGALATRPGVVTSPTNFVFNHLGMFADLMRPVCKSLMLGGVTRRFPDVAFAFLECGVSWAHQLLIDIVGHWQKRNVNALTELDPSRVDLDAIETMVIRYGGEVFAGRTSESDRRHAYAHEAIDFGGPDNIDDFASLGATSVADLVHLFADSFFFGCEADDGGVATAFAPTNPMGAQLGAMFSSDIGHWDVHDPAAVVPECYELLADGVLTANQFRAFTFGNAVRLYTRANPGFFEGTAVAGAAASMMSESVPG